jgi:hypothetical protein
VSRLAFTLTIVGLLSALLILVSWYLVPALFSERSDGNEEGSTNGLHKTVPRYSRETSTEGSQETVPQYSHEESTEILQGTVSQYSYENFPTGLHGNVPQYHIVSVKSDWRECYTPDYSAAHCYFVATKAGDKRAWALIVEDIIRDDNLEATSDKMVRVDFSNPIAKDDGGSAIAFRSKALAEEYLSTQFEQTPVVIDGVYIFNSPT